MKGSFARAAIVLSAALAAASGAASAAAAQEAPLQAPPAATILARLDANESFKSIRYLGRMEITIGGETRVKTMTALAMGSDKAFVEFTNPEDRGIRYLKLGSDLWMYFPKEADTVKISGHLLKEGMMGSDVSYEDALESKDLAARYAATVKGREALDGRDCWLVELKARVATAPYDRRLLWIDAERWIALKEEMYAKSGKLLKTSATLEVKRIGERWFPTRCILVSALRKGTSTTFFLDKVELDPPLDAKAFTMGALTR
jgi:outer membrane lipoprotein-sorting protein